MTDWPLADAFFLTAHPSWSQRDLDETDQDIIDRLAAIDHEMALEAERQTAAADREAKAAAHRARITGRR